MFKLFNFVSVITFLFLLFATTSNAQTGGWEDDRLNTVYAKAYDQNGFFCGYWDDCQDGGSCDGLYAISIKIKNDVFNFTANIPKKDDVTKLLGLQEGTPINFDFQVRMLFYDGEPLFPTPSLTRFSVSGNPSPNVCPVSK
jgi:hypothetical protein